MGVSPPAVVTRDRGEAREGRSFRSVQSEADSPRVRILSRDRGESGTGASPPVTRATEPGRSVDNRPVRPFDSDQRREDRRDDRRDGRSVSAGDAPRSAESEARVREQREQREQRLQQEASERARSQLSVPPGERNRDIVRPQGDQAVQRERERRERRNQQEAADRARDAQRQAQPLSVTPSPTQQAQQPAAPVQQQPPRGQPPQAQAPQIQSQASRAQPPQAQAPQIQSQASRGQPPQARRRRRRRASRSHLGVSPRRRGSSRTTMGAAASAGAAPVAGSRLSCRAAADPAIKHSRTLWRIADPEIGRSHIASDARCGRAPPAACEFDDTGHDREQRRCAMITSERLLRMNGRFPKK